jgi:fucose 4-O-acetylase-like acetyltransferase
MSERIKWIDISKAIGIFLVVFVHTLGGLFESGLLSNKDLYYTIFNVVYGFHMPLFFLISGYFAEKWSHKDIKPAIKEKFAVILYPYFLWTLLHGSIKVLSGTLANDHYSFMNIANSYYKPIDHLWFLYVLFFMFVSFILFRKKFRIGSVLIISFAVYFLQGFTPETSVITKFLRNFVYFALGAYFANKSNLQFITEKISKPAVALASILLFFVLNFVHFDTLLSNNYTLTCLYKICDALCGSILVFSIAAVMSDKYFSNTLVIIGKLSMVIYVSHIMFAASTRVFIQKIFHLSSFPVHILAGTLAGFVFPMIFYYVIKKYNMVPVFFGRALEK